MATTGIWIAALLFYLGFLYGRLPSNWCIDTDWTAYFQSLLDLTVWVLELMVYWTPFNLVIGTLIVVIALKWTDYPSPGKLFLMLVPLLFSFLPLALDAYCMIHAMELNGDWVIGMFNILIWSDLVFTAGISVSLMLDKRLSGKRFLCGSVLALVTIAQLISAYVASLALQALSLLPPFLS